jgi:Ni,Fe-hydrogenase I small subunit
MTDFTVVQVECAQNDIIVWTLQKQCGSRIVASIRSTFPKSNTLFVKLITVLVNAIIRHARALKV